MCNLLARPYYPDICVDIDIAEAVKNTSIRSITFLVGELSNHGIHLEIKDKATVHTFYDIP